MGWIIQRFLLTIASNEVILSLTEKTVCQPLPCANLFKINLHLKSDTKCIEINGKILILFDSNACTRSHISYDSISVTAWQDLLFLYIFIKASSDLFCYYYFLSWTYHTSSHFNISRGLPDLPIRQQLNSLLRCELCVTPQTHQSGFWMQL